MKTSLVDVLGNRLRRIWPQSAVLLTWQCLVLMSSPLAAGAAPPEAARGPGYQQTILEIQRQIESGDLVEARRLIAIAQAKYPHNGGLENLLGVVEIQQSHDQEAERDFSAAIADDPRLTGAFLNLSRLEMQRAPTDPAVRMRALRHSLKAVQLDPRNDEGQYQLANLYLWNRQYRLSLEHLEKLGPSARKQVGAEALFCADQAEAGSRDQAASALAALAANPDLSEDDANTCLDSLRSARRADLIRQLFAAVEERGKLSAGGMRVLGLAEEAEGKLPEARKTLESAFARSESSVVILKDLARIARAMNDNDGALGYLAHARDLAPADATLPFDFAAVCLHMGLFGEARRALGEALRLSPDNADYNLAMGKVISYSSDPSQALPFLNRYVELRPRDPEGWLATGAANFRAKDYENAAVWLRRAAARGETEADAEFYLGRIALEQGRLDEAARDLKRSLSLRPDGADTVAELGQISLLERDFPQASQRFEQALRLEPDNYTANFGLLQLYARTSDSRRAQQSERFDQIKNKKEEQDRQMMRMIEIRREDASDSRPQSSSQPPHNQSSTPHGDPE